MRAVLHRPGEGERRHDYRRDRGEAAKSGPLTPEIIGRTASGYDFQAA